MARDEHFFYRVFIGLAERSRDLFWAMSTDYKDQLYVSPIFEEIWGRSCQELNEHPERWIEWVHPEDREQMKKSIAARSEAVSPNAAFFEKYRIIRPDGSIRYIEDQSFPIFDINNVQVGFAGIAQDKTFDVLYAMELEQKTNAAEAANKAKNEFIRNMSHDLRTPLSGIIGMADIIKRKPEEEISKEGAHDIHEAGLSLMSLLNEIIETAQIEFGEVRHEESCFSLRKILASLMQMVSPALKQKGVLFENVYDDNIPEMLFGSSLLLHRVVLNLLGNAVKFTEKGKISVETSLVEKNGDAVALSIIIKDTGLGIPHDKQEMIFEKFTRLTSSYQNNYKGSGLGLFMVKQFVEQMGGSITVNSTLGKGSVFRLALSFCLPTKEQLDQYEKKMTEPKPRMHFLAQEIENTAPAKIEEPDVALKDEKKLHILLVEDTAVARKVAQEMLIHAGYEVTTAETATAAIEMSKKYFFDLIFMDIGLPDGNGIDVAKCIREEENPNKHTCIVALTAHSDAAVRASCVAAGMQKVLDKPLCAKKIESAEAACRIFSMDNAYESSANTAELPVIDMDFMAGLIGGKIDVSREMMNDFMNDLPVCLESITEAFEKQDVEKLKYHVHRLHGSLCYTGILRLKKTAENFEKHLSQGLDIDAKDYDALMHEAKVAMKKYHELFDSK